MDKRIAFYSKKRIRGPWPHPIGDKFKSYMSRFGIPYFDEGSEEEKMFIAMCANLGLEIKRETILKVTGKDLYKHPFHYLSVPNPRNINYDENIMDYSNACSNCGFGTYRIGAQQVRKIKLNYDNLKPYDIMQLPDHRRPSIYLVSRKLKDLMEHMDLTGCRIVPCLDIKKKYSKDEEDFNIQSNKLEEEARYFQLEITEKDNNPPYCGGVENIDPPCSSCNTYHTYLLDIWPYYKQGDLKNVDFQYSEQYNSENLGRFYTSMETIIISSRVLKLFIENKIRLARYLTDPPIKYGVVEVWGLNKFE